MWTFIIIVFILFCFFGVSGSDSSGGTGDKVEPLPPDMYDPLYDFDFDGKQSDMEKFCQTKDWIDYHQN